MSLHIKVNGVWQTAQRPYVKKNGVWVPASEAWIKQNVSGVHKWVRAYEYDVTPPNPPEITLEVVEKFITKNGKKTLDTRYIKVGARLPGSAHDPDARLIRVLTTYNGKAPTTQYGGTYTSTPDTTYPGEPWSEWRYNAQPNDGYHHGDTSVYIYKQWPPNVGSGYTIPGDKTYYFTGWSLDDNGNWSTKTDASIHIPKDSVDMPSIVVKEARIQPNTSGSWRSDGFHAGDLIQQNSPRSYGLWIHGNQFTDSIGARGTPTVRSAQIYIRREGSAEDIGSATCDLYLFWHKYNSVGALPAPAAPGGLAVYEITKLTTAAAGGRLAKGEGRWFNVPPAFFNNMDAGIKGMGLWWKDYVKASAFQTDYSRIVSTGQALRCGEVHIVWEEKL